jgi:transposase
MDLLVRRLFGRSSEKLDPNQLALFDTQPVPEEAPATATPEESSRPPSNPSQAKNNSRRPRRADRLERVEVIHDLSEAEKRAWAGDGKLVPLGDEITEQYEWEPSSLYVVRHIQKKYVRRPQLAESGPQPDQKNVITTPKPPQPLPGSQAGPGLLACVLTDKYVDHLPLHRQERRFARHGLPLSRQTTCDWVLGCAELFGLLYQCAGQVVLASRKVHTDDTPVRIRDARQKQKYTGRFWVYVGDEEHPLVFFDYTPSHQRDGPAAILKNFRGFLQADAFSGYDGIYAGSKGAIQEVACWSHARRKYFEARGTDRLRAETALAYIGQLFTVERELKERRAGPWRDLPREQQYVQVAAARQERSRQVLEQFFAWLTAEAPQLLPKHPLRQAMDYTLGNWQALCRYTEHGFLAIDNNTAENEVRRIALGRKNWLHCGSDRGARAAAVHYTLIASCQRNGVEPFRYLRELLTWLPVINAAPAGTFPADVIRDLLPDRWAGRQP